ncbi:MAG: gamma carbonic anhydrase family protein [Negativicutes bacterium]|nr:gamma carbonic anhydrase family protein [Negativicutes bacterium]
MLFDFEGNRPQVAEKAHIADGAKIIGKVTMKEFSSVWYNAVLRGDVNRIEIGRYSNVQDNSVVHVTDDYAAIIGDFVTVAHGAVLHGCTVEDHCLIGMGAVVLSGAVIGQGSIVAAGALVREKQVVPPHSLVVGVPAKVVKEIPEERDAIHAQAVKYKTLWTKRYGLCPDAGGEEYHGEKIV